MEDDDKDAQAEEARKEARRAQLMSWFWWIQVPIVCGTFYFEIIDEKVILTYLAAVSIIANAVSYSGKQKAAEAKEAGYENP